MMTETFDTIIMGGGMAGLSLSIQLAEAGRRVMVLERNKFPFHRVCGEYVSMESWSFLERIGMPLSSMQLPAIKKLVVSSANGKVLTHALEPGGFGISRYLLDASLANIGRLRGAEIIEQCKVEDCEWRDGLFHVVAGGKKLTAKTVVGSFGKRSNMDKKLQRHLPGKTLFGESNWVGVKYHLTSDLPADVIHLHNFDGGYCGVSKVEGSVFCLCYLTRAANLKKFDGQISKMEEQILMKNPFLAKIFSNRSAFLFEEPVTISQINFGSKLPVEKGILMAGDAAGLVAPLCGNGMSMALHAASICFELLEDYFKGRIKRAELESLYAEKWNKHFAMRLMAGKILQPLLVNSVLSNPAIFLLKHFPMLMNKIVMATHGKSF